MPTVEQLSSALIKADAAGDSDAAKAFASEIRRLKQTAAPAQASAEFDPTEGMSGLEKFAAGFGKSIKDTGRGVGQLVGMVSESDIDEARRLDAPLMKTGAGAAGNIVGNIATMLPAAFIPGVNTAVGGAALGAGLGSLQPVGTKDSRLQNAAIGGVAGGVVPALMSAGKSLKSAIYDPLMGHNNIIGSTLARVVGNDADSVVSALRGGQAVNAKTPGVRLSSGTISGNSGLSALEDAIRSQVPNSGLAELERSNAKALADSLRKIAGTPEEMFTAKSLRDETANKMYEAARLKGVDAAQFSPEAQRNIAEFAQRIPDKVLKKAVNLAKIEGVKMNDSSSIQGMHWVKKALDSEIKSAVGRGDGTMARSYSMLQDDLLTGLSRMSPEYDAARNTFSELSKPINQMEVGQYLANKLIPATAGDSPASLNYASLANAMRNPEAAARLATGFSGADMGKIMGEKMGTISGVNADASRIAESLRRGIGSGSPTARRLAQGNMLSQHFAENSPTISRAFNAAKIVPGLNLMARGASTLGDMAGSKINASILGRIDDILANNPAEAAAMIERELSKLNPSQRQQIMMALPQSVALGLSTNISQ